FSILYHLLYFLFRSSHAPPTVLYSLSLHDALPIYFFLPRNPVLRQIYLAYLFLNGVFWGTVLHGRPRIYTYIPDSLRSFVSIDSSEEHTSELQSRFDLVCRLLLEKKNDAD